MEPITLIVYILVGALVLSACYAVVRYWIMPAVAPAAQPWVWAVIGIIVLIAILALVPRLLSGAHLLTH